MKKLAYQRVSEDIKVSEITSKKIKNDPETWEIPIIKNRFKDVIGMAAAKRTS